MFNDFLEITTVLPDVLRLCFIPSTVFLNIDLFAGETFVFANSSALTYTDNSVVNYEAGDKVASPTTTSPLSKRNTFFTSGDCFLNVFHMPASI